MSVAGSRSVATGNLQPALLSPSQKQQKKHASSSRSTASGITQRDSSSPILPSPSQKQHKTHESISRSAASGKMQRNFTTRPPSPLQKQHKKHANSGRSTTTGNGKRQCNPSSPVLPSPSQNECRKHTSGMNCREQALPSPSQSQRKKRIVGYLSTELGTQEPKPVQTPVVQPSHIKHHMEYLMI